MTVTNNVVQKLGGGCTGGCSGHSAAGHRPIRLKSTANVPVHSTSGGVGIYLVSLDEHMLLAFARVSC